MQDLGSAVVAHVAVGDGGNVKYEIAVELRGAGRRNPGCVGFLGRRVQSPDIPDVPTVRKCDFSHFAVSAVVLECILSAVGQVDFTDATAGAWHAAAVKGTSATT